MLLIHYKVHLNDIKKRSFIDIHSDDDKEYCSKPKHINLDLKSLRQKKVLGIAYITFQYFTYPIAVISHKN